MPTMIKAVQISLALAVSILPLKLIFTKKAQRLQKEAIRKK